MSARGREAVNGAEFGSDRIPDPDCGFPAQRAGSLPLRSRRFPCSSLSSNPHHAHREAKWSSEWYASQLPAPYSTFFLRFQVAAAVAVLVLHSGRGMAQTRTQSAEEGTSIPRHPSRRQHRQTQITGVLVVQNSMGGQTAQWPLFLTQFLSFRIGPPSVT
jgi:hypothetical protein